MRTPPHKITRGEEEQLHSITWFLNSSLVSGLEWRVRSEIEHEKYQKILGCLTFPTPIGWDIFGIFFCSLFFFTQIGTIKVHQVFKFLIAQKSNAFTLARLKCSDYEKNVNFLDYFLPRRETNGFEVFSMKKVFDNIFFDTLSAQTGVPIFSSRRDFHRRNIQASQKPNQKRLIRRPT